MIENGFILERGQPSAKKHLSVQDYKEITNYEKSIKTIKDISLDIPSVPNIKDLSKIMFNRDDKIQKEIIVPKDNLIKQLHSDNLTLHKELDKQIHIIDKASKFEKEYNSIMSSNKELEEKCTRMENKFETLLTDKTTKLESDYQSLIYDIEQKAKKKQRELEKENRLLHRIINIFQNTVEKIFTWVCKKFDVSVETTVRDFEKENHICLDPYVQIEREDREKEDELEM